MLIFIFFIFNYFGLSLGINRIWFIRHCDKPHNNKNPCCSMLGYKRAENWDYYLTKYLTKNDSIKIVTSNFNTNKVCMMDLDRTPDSYCPKSQRMYLTSHLIYHNMKRINMYNISYNINKNFCVGEAKKMLSSILKTETSYSDIIIVWEHKEISDLIQKFDIKISKWKNIYRDHYDLLFMIDIENNELFYDCFDYKTLTTGCSKKIDEWLRDYKKINDYYQKDKVLRSTYFTNKTPQDLSWFYGFLTLSVILFYACIIISYALYIFAQEYISSYRRRMQGYILIR